MASEKRLIDADALMKYINETHSYAGLPMAAHICTMELLTYAPIVDAVEVVHGWWIELPGMEPDYKCSECGHSYAWWEPSEAHYCPNCGAKMDGDLDG